MKKFILFCLFISSVFASEIKVLKNIEELKENKNIFLMFSTESCPWCAKQVSILEDIQKEKKDLEIFKVNDDTLVYKELLKKYSFVIKYYPTSYIVTKEDGNLNINYEFQGYQKKKNILAVLNDEDSF
ncbi:MAG: thioredoxin family protein [Halarcobacter sp.]